jgi:hypothetical protein
VTPAWISGAGGVIGHDDQAIGAVVDFKLEMVQP